MLLILISFNINAQKRISYVSCGRDTIILPNNQVGLKIYLTWFDKPIDERPTILFSNESYIKYLNDKQIINYTFKEEELTEHKVDKDIWLLD